MLAETITLFNYHMATGSWHPSIINGVDVDYTESTNASAAGRTNSAAVDLILPCSAARQIQTTKGLKSYVKPKEYAETNAPGAVFTLAPECDFIFVGAWPSTDALPDEDYESGLYHAINDEHDGVYMIHSVSFFDLIPHFEIGGR